METFFEIIEALPAWFIAIDGLLIALLAVAAFTPTKKDDTVLLRAKNVLDKLRGLLFRKP